MYIHVWKKLISERLAAHFFITGCFVSLNPSIILIWALKPVMIGYETLGFWCMWCYIFDACQRGAYQLEYDFGVPVVAKNSINTQQVYLCKLAFARSVPKKGVVCRNCNFCCAVAKELGWKGAFLHSQHQSGLQWHPRCFCIKSFSDINKAP